MKRKRKVGKLGGAVGGALLALPFAAVGVTMLVLIIRCLLAAAAMREWEPVSCTIRQAGLETSSGDSTTYKVTATYTYTVNDRAYTGRRVALLAGGFDNIGTFHQRTYRLLREHRDNGEPVTGYVDLRDPSRAILFRRPRWEMVLFFALFAVVFGGVGFALLVASVLGLRRAARGRAAAKQHPDQPWLTRPDWAKGVVYSDSKVGALVLLSVAVFWNAVSIPVGWMAVRDEFVAHGNRLALLALVFPGVGLFIAAGAVHAVLRWLRYQGTRFEMAGVPGVVGGRLAGVVHIPVRLTPPEGFAVTLTCLRTVTRRSGGKTSTSEVTVWESEKRMRRDLLAHDPTRCAVPVLFHVPCGQPPTSPDEPAGPVAWKLAVRAGVPGVDYHARFEVPVFRTAESSADFVLDESAIAAYVATPAPDAALRAVGAREEPIPGGVRITFPPARQRAAAVVLAAFATVWTGIVVLLARSSAPRFLAVVFGLFDVLIVAGAAHTCLWSSRLDVRHRQVRLAAGLLGFGRRRAFDRADITSIQTTAGMLVGSRQYHNIVLQTRNGRRFTVATAAGILNQAQAVAAHIRSAMDRAS